MPQNKSQSINNTKNQPSPEFLSLSLSLLIDGLPHYNQIATSEKIPANIYYSITQEAEAKYPNDPAMRELHITMVMISYVIEINKSKERRKKKWAIGFGLAFLVQLILLVMDSLFGIMAIIMLGTGGLLFYGCIVGAIVNLVLCIKCSRKAIKYERLYSPRADKWKEYLDA